MIDVRGALPGIEDSMWRRSPTASSTIKWLPLWLYTDTGLWLGVDEEARWVLGRPGRMDIQGSDRLLPSWVPVLDRDEMTVREEISFSASKYGLPAEPILESLPIDDIIAMALTFSNAHWIERALNWLETRNIREDIRAMLPAVATSRAAGQRSRQKATRLMRQH
jgi:hypothetical protein